jgi:hypothetical protein
VRRALLVVAAAVLAQAGAASPACADDRPYVWTYDPDGPRDEEVELVYVLNATAGATGAIRLADIGREGTVQQVGLQVALAPWIALSAYGLVSLGNPLDVPANASAGGMIQFTLLRPEPGHDGGSIALAVSGLREFPGQYADVFALSAWLEGGYRAGIFSIAGNVQVEHRFAPIGDPVDLMARVGAMFDVSPELRLGAEYVAQDLEDYMMNTHEVEGGARHLAALSFSGHVDREGFTFGLSPGAVFGGSTVGFGGRGFLAWRFYGW